MDPPFTQLTTHELQLAINALNHKLSIYARWMITIRGNTPNSIIADGAAFHSKMMEASNQALNIKNELNRRLWPGH